jgi:hypothetical protein
LALVTASQIASASTASAAKGHFTLRVDAVDLKNRPRNIETDRRNSLAGPRKSPAKQPRAFAETILAAAEHHCGNVF